MYAARRRLRSSRGLLAELAADELRQLRKAEEQEAKKEAPPEETFTDGEALLDFQEETSSHLIRPTHFKCYLARVERAVGGGLRVVFAAPPQHGKSQCTLHGLAFVCKKHPTKRHAYITYNQQRAERVAKEFKRILARAGIEVDGTLDCLQLPGGGQVLFTSIEGGITGEPVDGIAIIDDPFKNVTEANSAARRELVDDCYRSAIETRVHPGASILLLATRWHPEDLSGVLIREGWEYINLPAIAENDNDPNGREIGEALFPALWPIEELEKKREKVLDFTWAALYQGRPRPKGGTIFHEPTFYTELPVVYQAAFGVDLAYTESTKADWSICLELWRAQGDDGEPLFYVKHVERKQVEAPDFAKVLKRLHKAKPRLRMLWRASGTEKGSADFMRRQGIPLRVVAPPGDKIVASQDAAAAWNAGRILVPDVEAFPEAESWLQAFLSILANFTGSGKEHDDDVDALANAHWLLDSGLNVKLPDPGRRRAAGDETGGF